MSKLSLNQRSGLHDSLKCCLLSLRHFNSALNPDTFSWVTQCGRISLTYNCLFHMLKLPESEFFSNGRVSLALRQRKEEKMHPNWKLRLLLFAIGMVGITPALAIGAPHIHNALVLGWPVGGTKQVGDLPDEVSVLVVVCHSSIGGLRPRPDWARCWRDCKSWWIATIGVSAPCPNSVAIKSLGWASIA